MKEWIVLLRAIGPATHKMMSMTELRADCEAAGLVNVSTVLATGNLLCSSPGSEHEMKEIVSSVVRKHGLDNEVFVRSTEEVGAVMASNPIPGAANDRPNHLLVLFLDRAASEVEAAKLAEYDGPERVAVSGREVFIDYREGVGRSKLSPAVLERRLGQAGTARNWNTVGKLLAACRHNAMIL